MSKKGLISQPFFYGIFYYANKKPRILAGLVVYESSRILYEAHLKLRVLNHI